MAGVNPRRIGLSATIGDPKGTGEFLASGTGRGTIIPQIEQKGVRWRLSMEHFYVQGPQSAQDKQVENALPVLDEATDAAPESADPGIGYIFEHTRGKNAWYLLTHGRSARLSQQPCASTVRPAMSRIDF